MSINRVNISGNLTRDPELRATQTGTPVLKFGVAVNDRTKDPLGQWVDRPNFVDCVMFGNRAQAVQRFLSKGSKVSLEGKLRYSSWQDKQTGQNRSKIEVVVDEVEFMTARDQGQQDQGRAQAPQQAPQYAQAPQYQQDPQAPMAPQQAPQYAQAPQYQQDPQAPMAPQAAPAVYDQDIPF
jgi:single-strand DNA-binding protein